SLDQLAGALQFQVYCWCIEAGIHMYRPPGSMLSFRHAMRCTDQAGILRTSAEGDENLRPYWPRALHTAHSHGITHIRVHPLGHGLHGQLTQGSQVRLTEEAVQRRPGLLRDIHLALLKTLDQFI